MSGDASLGAIPFLGAGDSLPNLSTEPDATDLLEQGLALAMDYGNVPFMVWERWIYRVQQFLVDEEMRHDEEEI